jgi:hypothetical protein
MADTAVLDGLGRNHYGSIPIPMLDLVYANANPPTVGNLDDFQYYAYTINDNSNFGITVPRDWLPTSNMLVQVYWGANETFAFAGASARWQIITEPIAWNGTVVLGSGTATTVNGVNQNVPAAARAVTTTTLTMDGTLLAVGNLVRIKLTRIAVSAGGVEVTAEPEVSRVVVHYARQFPAYSL